MVCPKCKSGALSTVPAEIRLYRNAPRTMSHPPMSPQPDIQVCLDCGNAEFLDPRKMALGRLASGGRPKAAPVSVPTPINEVRRHIA